MFVNNEKLGVWLPQRNRGSSRRIVDQSQFSEVVAFLKSANDALKSKNYKVSKIFAKPHKTTEVHTIIESEDRTVKRQQVALYLPLDTH